MDCEGHTRGNYAESQTVLDATVVGSLWDTLPDEPQEGSQTESPERAALHEELQIVVLGVLNAERPGSLLETRQRVLEGTQALAEERACCECADSVSPKTQAVGARRVRRG